MTHLATRCRWLLRLRHYYASNTWQVHGQKVHLRAYTTPPWPWPLTFWPQKLTCSSLLKNSLVVKVWSNSGNKYPRYLANNVCSGLKHAWMHDHSGNTLMFWPLHQQRHKDRFKLVSWVFPTVQKTQPKDGRCSMNIMDIATPLWMWSHEAILFRA